MTDGTLDEDMTILLGLHAHPGWLIDKCAACQASKRIMERFRELEAELALPEERAFLKDTALKATARAERAESKLNEERESHHRQMGGLRGRYEDTVETSRIRADRIRDLETRVAAYENNEPMTIVDGKTIPLRFVQGAGR